MSIDEPEGLEQFAEIASTAREKLEDFGRKIAENEKYKAEVEAQGYGALLANVTLREPKATPQNGSGPNFDPKKDDGYDTVE